MDHPIVDLRRKFATTCGMYLKIVSSNLTYEME